MFPEYQAYLAGGKPYGDTKSSWQAALALVRETGADIFYVVKIDGEEKRVVYVFDRNCKFAGQTDLPFEEVFNG